MRFSVTIFYPFKVGRRTVTYKIENADTVLDALIEARYKYQKDAAKNMFPPYTEWLQVTVERLSHLNVTENVANKNS